MSTASTSRVHNKCRVEQVDTTDRRAHTETRTARDPHVREVWKSIQKVPLRARLTHAPPLISVKQNVGDGVGGGHDNENSNTEIEKSKTW